MTAAEIVEMLRPMGRESYRKVMLKHGAQEPIFGVAIADMKPIQKQVKTDYQLALDLYATGIYDAMYLAGLIADDAKMTKDDLERWLDQANCSAISNVTVAWVAAMSPHGWELGLDWIDRGDEKAKCAGWAALSGWISTRPNALLDIQKIRDLLAGVRSELHDQSDGLKYQMNGFVIAAGSYIPELTDECLQLGRDLGNVQVNLIGDCKLPPITDYVTKVIEKGRVGIKRKTVKC